ncbi:ABC transporter substrate-binding protein [Planotetraspora sp. GP83]|uniref:ABC transporter substrate-binding protein n=1 Tax=Planotetraspora sp. GP83 TaxID=3156264 RepID=UPI0035169575
MRTVTSVLVLTLTLGAGLTACSGNSPSAPSTSTSTTLRLALSADPAPLDPDTYYEAEGLQITTAAYQGLLTYKPDSAEITGLLAKSWKVSSDGKTYTFALRTDVKFSDGTAFDAAAMKASFERRVALAGGPAYTLAEVESTDAPDPATFVVRLKRPVAPFLDYLASPYGPVAVSPAAAKAHATGDDHGAGWLGAHTAGTGPYQLSSVVKTTRYVLTANPHYWGVKPRFAEVDFAVVPDFSTQSIELQGGQLDMVLHGLNTRDYAAIKQNPGFQVRYLPTLFKTQLWVNPDSAVFGPLAARQALRDSLDTVALTKQIYGDRATASTEVYPEGMLPKGAAPDMWQANPQALTTLSGNKGKSVTIGYYGDNSLQQLANMLQIQLQQAGLTATVRPYGPAQVFALPAEPKQRPDILVAAMNPDAAHVDTWMSIYQATKAPVNFLGCSVPAADKLADAARVTVDRAESQELYTKAAREYQNSLCWINIADVRDTIAAKAGLTGWRHQMPWVFTVDLAALEPTS